MPSTLLRLRQSNPCGTSLNSRKKLGKPRSTVHPKQLVRLPTNQCFIEDLQKNGFSIPKTLLLNLADSLTQNKQAVKRELAYPVVVKPVDGVGCSGLSVVKEETELVKAIAKVKAESKTGRFVAQEFISGESASVSLLSTGKKAMALSLNKQNVTLAGPEGESSYDGGIVPLHYWLKQDVFNVAEKVVEAFPGLRGYVGVDFVLTEHKAFVVDVNPRLTTSYVGLRRIAGFNVAEAVVDAVVKGKLPSKHGNPRLHRVSQK